MKHLTGAFLAVALLGLVGCGGGGGGDGTAGGGNETGGTAAANIIDLAQTMINEATSEDCPSEEHCIPWPVETLATVTAPDDADPVDTQ